MKHCISCGEKNTTNAAFCVHCGKEFEGGNSSASDQPSIPKKKMTREKTVLFSVLGTLALLLIIIHLVLSNLYDPMKKIQAMNQAYNAQDKEAFFDEFHLKEGTVADAESFYSIVNDYGWTSLRDSLTYEVEKIKNNEHTNIIYHTGEFIVLNKKPVLFGLYNQVEFTIIPTEVSVHVPYKNMTIQFGGKEIVSEADNDTLVLGHFITGTYEWKYEYEGGLMPLLGEGNYTIHPQENNAIIIDIDWDFETLVIESDLADAVLFVDGKSTGKTVSELNEFYPAQIRPSSEIYAQYKDENGNEVKSDILPIDRDYLYLTFDHIQQEFRIAEHEDAIRSLYKNFRSDYENAIHYTSFSYIEDYFKDGSTIKKDYAKFVTDHDEIPGYRYEFLLNDVTSFKAISDSQFELQSFETFNFSSNDDGTLYYERKKKYIVSYEDERYTIDAITDLDTKKTKR